MVKYPEELPYSIDDGSPVMIGDYILYIDEANNEIPKYWTGAAWADVTENTFNFSQIMDGVLDDALTQEGTIPSTSVLYAYIGRIASKAALIEQLYAINLMVGNVTESNPNVGFRFRALAKDDDGNPIVDAVYNGKTIFKILPATGRIFFGGCHCRKRGDEGIVPRQSVSF